MNRASRNRHNSCADGEVCSIRVITLNKMLATVGIVRDKAQTTQTGSVKTAYISQSDVPGKSD